MVGNCFSLGLVGVGSPDPPTSPSGGLTGRSLQWFGHAHWPPSRRSDACRCSSAGLASVAKASPTLITALASSAVPTEARTLKSPTVSGAVSTTSASAVGRGLGLAAIERSFARFAEQAEAHAVDPGRTEPGRASVRISLGAIQVGFTESLRTRAKSACSGRVPPLAGRAMTAASSPRSRDRHRSRRAEPHEQNERNAQRPKARQGTRNVRYFAALRKSRARRQKPRPGVTLGRSALPAYRLPGRLEPAVTSLAPPPDQAARRRRRARDPADARDPVPARGLRGRFRARLSRRQGGSGAEPDDRSRSCSPTSRCRTARGSTCWQRPRAAAPPPR